MQHIYDLAEAYRIDSTIRIAVKVFDQFNDTAPKSLQGLGRRWMLSGLHQEQCEAEIVLHAFGKPPIVAFTGSDPSQRA